MSFCLIYVSVETASKLELWVQVSFQNLETQDLAGREGSRAGKRSQQGVHLLLDSLELR